MNIEDVARHGADFGQQAGERLHALLGQLPTPQEYMAFYAAASGTIAGNALAEIVANAGKEFGVQWLRELLGVVQLTARRCGADVILSGGLSLKAMATVAQTPAAPAPEESPLTQNICQCEIVSGKCWSCQQGLERKIERFASLLKNLVVDTAAAADAPVCPVCRAQMMDDLLAAAVRKHAPSFGDRLGPAVEIFLAVVLPQVKAAMPEVAWNKTLEAVSEQASASGRSG